VPVIKLAQNIEINRSSTRNIPAQGQLQNYNNNNNNNNNNNSIIYYKCAQDRDNVVVTETPYGVDGPGI
jgi:hypothetical protein